MLKFYYTNISENGGIQTRSDLSLGGYKSATVVPNDSVGNLFSDISVYSVRENRDEYIALTLVNETGAEVTDVILYFDYPENRQKDIELAFVSFNLSDEIEIIPNSYSKPFNATFNAADGVDNALNIGTLAVGAKIGVWFKKILNVSNIKLPYGDSSLEDNGNPSIEIEDISLIVSWT